MQKNRPGGLALGYIPKELAGVSTGFEIEILGERCAATRLDARPSTRLAAACAGKANPHAILRHGSRGRGRLHQVGGGSSSLRCQLNAPMVGGTLLVCPK